MTSASGFALRPVELEAAVGRSVSEARSANPDADVTVALPDDVSVEADDLLGSVLRNLLSNAVEHNDADTAEVHVEAAVDGDTVRLRVSDNGPGIPPSERESYFEAGNQDDSSVGQGLGLYLVDTLVTRYGGDVRIDDNEPRGTTVTVQLQLAGG